MEECVLPHTYLNQIYSNDCFPLGLAPQKKRKGCSLPEGKSYFFNRIKFAVQNLKYQFISQIKEFFSLIYDLIDSYF